MLVYHCTVWPRFPEYEAHSSYINICRNTLNIPGLSKKEILFTDLLLKLETEKRNKPHHT
jgi:hypothetical protein